VDRIARHSRETSETTVKVEINLDGTGQYEVKTGNGMLDHMLAQLARHGLLDLKVEAKGDLGPGWHHLVEDVGITLGQALRQAVGEGKGIVRMGHAVVPLDETLVQVALDLGGRGYAVVDIGLSNELVGDLPGDLLRHFLESLAFESRMSLHAKIIQGVNPHHKAEATFKALARALNVALRIDPRRAGDVPSTKGTISA
jgi:imidazoleglycerol-phosphate dehydratase